jgi:hypothetical protein
MQAGLLRKKLVQIPEADESRRRYVALCLYVLPADLEKNTEPTSGLEPLTCSLRVCLHAF